MRDFAPLCISSCLIAVQVGCRLHPITTLMSSYGGWLSPPPLSGKYIYIYTVFHTDQTLSARLRAGGTIGTTCLTVSMAMNRLNLSDLYRFQPHTTPTSSPSASCSLKFKPTWHVMSETRSRFGSGVHRHMDRGTASGNSISCRCPRASSIASRKQKKLQILAFCLKDSKGAQTLRNRGRN